MKKLLPVLLTILTCGAAYALPMGNPSEASLLATGVFWDGGCCDPCDPCFTWCDSWSLRTGFYGDYVFDRHLHNTSAAVAHGDIWKTRIYTNAGYLALNFCDRVDVFTNLGATRIKVTGDYRSVTGDLNQPGSTGSSDPNTLEYASAFSWGIGARATVWECDCLALGLEGQYFSTNPRISRLIEWDDRICPQSADLSRSHYYEWQIGLGVSYRFATQCPSIAMVPYFGVTWAGAGIKNHQLDIQGTIINLTSYDNNNTWGYVVGSSFTLCDVIGLTAEGRFGAEKALYVNGQFRF